MNKKKRCIYTDTHAHLPVKTNQLLPIQLVPAPAADIIDATKSRCKKLLRHRRTDPPDVAEHLEALNLSVSDASRVWSVGWGGEGYACHTSSDDMRVNLKAY